MPSAGPKIVMIGGGTGTFTVLSALKNYTNDITAVVNMVDDGGSTGVLRDELGVLPPGDIRQSLVALSNSPQIMRELFNYRFPEGTFEGHAFGNLFLTALEKITGSFEQAVETAGQVLAIQGKVVPVTTDNVRLCRRLPDGSVVEGQFAIEDSKFDKPVNLFLKPEARLNPKAQSAIEEANLVIIGPGNIYSSLVPNLLVKAMSEALGQTKAKIIYICNLVTKPGQTDDFAVHDFAAELERFIGQPVFDYVIYNTEQPSDELLKRYAREGERPVEFSHEILSSRHYQSVGEKLVTDEVFRPSPHDKLIKRTLIRHDSDKLAKLIMKIYFDISVENQPT